MNQRSAPWPLGKPAYGHTEVGVGVIVIAMSIVARKVKMAAWLQHPCIFREGAQRIGRVMDHAIRDDRIASPIAQRQPEIGRSDIGGVRSAAPRELERGEADVDRDHREAASRQIQGCAARAATDVRDVLAWLEKFFDKVAKRPGLPLFDSFLVLDCQEIEGM